MSLDTIVQPRIIHERFPLLNGSRILRADEAISDADVQLEVKAQRLRRKKLELTYEFTRDPGYLHQYCLIRSQIYQEKLGKDLYGIEPDSFDKEGLLLVVRQGDFVVGGGLLSITNPRVRRLLPTERDGFSYSAALPEKHLDHANYCEFSRFALFEEYRSPLVIAEMISHMARKGISLGASCAFARVLEMHERLYRQVFKTAGYADAGFKFEVLDTVVLPDSLSQFMGQRLKIVMYEAPRVNKG